MRIPEVQERQRQRMIKWTDEDLISHLTVLAQKLGRTPTVRETVPHDGTWKRAFGSYTNAVVLAGLTPNVQLPAKYLESERLHIPLSLRYEVLKRDGFRCQYCGGTPQDGYVLHVDHVIPRSKGGATAAGNLIAACWLCNLGKSDQLTEVG
jgi:hypothetical protein